MVAGLSGLDPSTIKVVTLTDLKSYTVAIRIYSVNRMVEHWAKCLPLEVVKVKFEAAK